MIQTTVLFLLCSVFVAYSTSPEELIADRKLYFSRIKNYESLHINLDQFASNNIIEFDAFNTHFTVQLEVNKDVHPIELRRDEATGIVTEHHPDPNEEYCFHQGRVLNDLNPSLVALSTCHNQGIRGSIHAFGHKLRLNPTSFYHAPLHDMHLTDEHMIYTSTDYDFSAEAKEYGQLEAINPNTYDNQTKTMRRLYSGGRYNGNGGKAQFLGIIDKSWLENKGSKSQAKSFFQGVVNLASSYLTNGRVKNAGSVPIDCRISLQWKYVVYYDMTNCKDSDTRRAPCLNAVRNIANDYSTYRDFGYAFARRPIRGGIATTAQICRPGNGISLSTSNYEQRASVVLAHEFGHLLGASHDRGITNTIMGDNDGTDWSQDTIDAWRSAQYSTTNYGWGCLNKHNLNSGEDDKLGNYGGNAPGGGTCCECASNPSKSRCNSACERAVEGLDSWCGRNAWDAICHAKAKKLCNGALTFTGCDDSKYTDGENSLCFYKREDEVMEFQMRDCIDTEAYQYIVLNGTDGRMVMEYWLHFENATAQWVISKDTISNFPLYYCQESDILECTTGKWAVSYVDVDAVTFKMDDNAWIAPCQGSNSEEKNHNEAINTEIILLVVLVTVCVGIIVLMMCYLKQKNKKKLAAFEEVYEEEEEEEEIEVELENETLETS